MPIILYAHANTHMNRSTEYMYTYCMHVINVFLLQLRPYANHLRKINIIAFAVLPKWILFHFPLVC